MEEHYFWLRVVFKGFAMIWGDLKYQNLTESHLRKIFTCRKIQRSLYPMVTSKKNFISSRSTVNRRVPIIGNLLIFALISPLNAKSQLPITANFDPKYQKPTRPPSSNGPSFSFWTYLSIHICYFYQFQYSICAF